MLQALGMADVDFDRMDVDVSENSGTPKASILIGFCIINHPFWGTTIFGNTHVWMHEDTILLHWIL